MSRVALCLALLACAACSSNGSTSSAQQDATSSRTGPRGPTGPTGPMGPTGPTGATGLTFARTILVSPGATATDSGAALLAAVAKVPSASSGQRWLVKVEPGRFDLGTSGLVLPTNADLEGSGESNTTIVSRSPVATLSGTGGSEARFLSVENRGGGSRTVAISGMNGFQARFVTATAQGDGDVTYGIIASGSSGSYPAWRNVSAYAYGSQTGSASYGFFCGGSSCNVGVADSHFGASMSRWASGIAVVDGALTVYRTETTGSNGSTSSYGIWAKGSMLELDDVKAQGTASGTSGPGAVGVYLMDTTAIIRNGQIYGGNSLTDNWGLYLEDGPAGTRGVNVVGTQINGASAAVRVGSAFIARLVNTALFGPVFGNGQKTCFNVFTSDYRGAAGGANACP